jgi:hypothetical protein
MSEPAPRFAIVDLRIPFVRLVLFFIKAGLALIPAAIILGILITLATALVTGILDAGGFAVMRHWRF